METEDGNYYWLIPFNGKIFIFMTKALSNIDFMFSNIWLILVEHFTQRKK